MFRKAGSWQSVKIPIQEMQLKIENVEYVGKYKYVGIGLNVQ